MREHLRWGLMPLCLGLILAIVTTDSEAAPAAKSDPRSAREALNRGRDRREKDKKPEAKKESADPESSDSLFLPETAENQSHVAELYRCPDCGYEQDEAGFCPDHDEQKLVQVLSQGKNPFAPAEVDGNEDLLVDLPLSGLQFRTGPTASGTAPLPGALPPSGQNPPRPPPGGK